VTDESIHEMMNHIREQNIAIVTVSRNQLGLHASITNAEDNIRKLWYMTIGLLVSIIGLSVIGLMMFY
jgi:hypothetical protein